MTTSAIAVSVIIPTFNAATFIEPTLASVCGQLKDGDELIVADDASSDATADVCRSFLAAHCSAKWRVVTREVNLGPPATRNNAIRHASGDVIMSVDQDDHWAPDHRSVLLHNLRDHEIVSGRARFHLSAPMQGKPGRKWWRDSWLQEPQQLCEFGASAIRRSCFERVGLLDESFRYGGDDVEWFGRAQARGLTRLEIPEVVLDRIIHNENLSGDPRLRQELLDVVRHHLRRDTT